MPTILLEYLKLYLLDDVAYNQTLIQQVKGQCLVLVLCLVQTLNAQELHTTSYGSNHFFCNSLQSRKPNQWLNQVKTLYHGVFYALFAELSAYKVPQLCLKVADELGILVVRM